MEIFVVRYVNGEIHYFVKRKDAERELWLTYMNLFGKMEDPALQNSTSDELNKFHMISCVGRIEAAWLNM